MQERRKERSKEEDKNIYFTTELGKSEGSDYEPYRHNHVW
jgi:hypothetical protein